jgi:predicted lipoprotein with Yx(FWY)xxD motif
MTTNLARAVAAIVLAGGAWTMAACDVADLGTSKERTSPAWTVPAAAPLAEGADRGTLAPRVEPKLDRGVKPILRATRTRAHGALVVDGTGMTLYRSDKDSARPPTSRCAGPCAALWKPALLAGAELPVVGVDPSIVGTITRADGARQLTIAGWPVYRFVKDKRAGDVAGQCKGGFFAVTPDGGKSM